MLDLDATADFKTPHYHIGNSRKYLISAQVEFILASRETVEPVKHSSKLIHVSSHHLKEQAFESTGGEHR